MTMHKHMGGRMGGMRADGFSSTFELTFKKLPLVQLFCCVRVQYINNYLNKDI